MPCGGRVWRIVQRTAGPCGKRSTRSCLRRSRGPSGDSWKSGALLHARRGAMGARMSTPRRETSPIFSRNAALIFLLVLSNFTCPATRVRAEQAPVQVLCPTTDSVQLPKQENWEGQRPDLVVKDDECLVPAG